MARYGMDYGRDFDRMGRGERFGGMGRARGGGWRPSEPMGGMRPGAWGNEWSDYPGEEGWYGEGYTGGAGGYGGGYDIGFQGGPREMRGTGGMGMGGMGIGGGYGYGGDFGAGSYGGYGYGGRDLGYGGGMGMGGWDMGEGMRRQGERGSQLRAADLMTENPEVVTPDATLADVAKKMREMDVGIIPVVDSRESRRLRGVITDRDIAIRAVAEGKDGKARVSDCMTTEVQTVNKNDPVQRVLGVMKREQVRRVPVTDREGRLVGIIAQADLVVDYAEHDPQRERMVEETIERISEPARPGRRRATIQARERTELEERLERGSEEAGEPGRKGSRGEGRTR